MRKKITIFIVLCFLLTSCNPYNDKNKRIDFFIFSFTDLIEYDAELNKNMKYIGIEILNDKLPEDSIKQILSHIENKYSVQTIVFSSEQKNKDMQNSNRYKLLLLSISITEIKSSYVKVSCSKIGAEMGAAGYSAYYKYKNGKWILIETEDGWLS